jgi:hypothetical protein
VEQHSNNSINHPILETHVGLPERKKYNKRLTGADYHRLHEFLAKVFVQIDGLWYWADGYNDQVVCKELQATIPQLTDKAVWRYRTANFGYPAEKPRRKSPGSGQASGEIEALQERVCALETVVSRLLKTNRDLAEHLADSGKEANELGLAIQHALTKLE